MSNRNGVWSLPAQYQAIADQDWTMAPGAPTGVSATAGDAQAEVSFTAPTFAGIPGTITQFKVTSSSGQTATGSASPITVTGLTNGSGVTFTAQAQNAIGLGKASDASSSVTPLATVISSLFECHLYDGNGSTQTITNGIDLSGEGGLVWIKDRNLAKWHKLYDTERGATKALFSNETDAENTNTTTLTSFNSNGFTLGAGGSGNNNSVNESSGEYVSWTFRKAPKFFDVVKYTGDGTNYRNISHNLGTTVGHVIIKKVSGGSAAGWINWHRTFSDYQSVFLNTTEAVYSGGSNGGVFGQTSGFTSTQFQLGGPDNITYHNENGSSYVAYVFAHNNNDGGFGPDSEDIIKCGSFTTDANEDATIDLGFEPQWVLFKRTDSSTGGDWNVYDNMRGMHGDFLSIAALLEPNTSDSEDATTNRIAITPTGFKIDNYGANRSYIYVAIRRPDMSTPTSSSEVFSVNETGTGDSPTNVWSIGFDADMNIHTRTNGEDNFILARLLGTYAQKTNATDAAGNQGSVKWFNDSSNSINLNTNWFSTNSNMISWSWKRARGYFDVVTYSGDGSSTASNRTAAISHNLGVQPEMIWVKRRDATSEWVVAHKDYGAGYLNLNNAFATYSSMSTTHNANFTATNFKIGAWQQEGNFNVNGADYIAYLFATVAGVSKVGSYTGNDTGQNIDCGFSNGAKFVLIKCSSHGDRSWMIFDSVRGIVSGADPFLTLETNSAQNYASNGAGSIQNYTSNNLDLIDPYSSGFAVVGGTGMVNENGKSYIFYAIAA